MKKILLAFALAFIPIAYGAMTCNVQSACDYTTVFKMSNTENAHAQPHNETGYSYKVCCNDDQFFLGNECSGVYINILNLSGPINAHAGYVTSYTSPVCIKTSGTQLSCRYDNSCTSDEACLASISGQTNAHVAACNYFSTKVCCSTLPSLGAQVFSVSFQLEMNISGSSGDSAQADTGGTGLYSPTDIDDYYTCIQDTSQANTPTFGLVFLGNTLGYINLTSGDSGGSYSMEISEASSGNHFVIPVTRGGCATIDGKMSTIKTFNALTQPFSPFAVEGENPVEIIISYPSVDIIGDFVKSSSFTLDVEKNESGGVSQIIFTD